MIKDPESLYRQMGRIIETMPDFSGYAPITDDEYLWIGRASALIEQGGNILDQSDWRMATKNLQTALRHDAVQPMKMVLFRVLAAAELNAPAGVRGSFIPVGNNFDAFSAVSKVLKTAKKDIMIVDPYMDESVLTDFAGPTPENVNLRLLADEAHVKPSLEPAAKRWRDQYKNLRPVELRLAAERRLHDRAIFIDHQTAWILTQSLKDIAKRSPAEIIRADDTASLKIPAYESIWQNSKVVV